jgi:hypothetical protein
MGVFLVYGVGMGRVTGVRSFSRPVTVKKEKFLSEDALTYDG